MILLDALCATTHRYLDEHPHLQLRDLLITVDMYQRLTMQIVSSRAQA
jgi:DNA polymerase III epsilon subunit-like protein